MRAEVAQLEGVRHQRVRRLGDAGGVGRRELLDPLRDADGVPLGGVVHAQVVADAADHHLAGVESHAHRQGRPVAPCQLGGERGQLVAQRQRRVTGALGVVLEPQRRAEQRHDAIAGVLVDGPLEAVHALGEEVEEAIEQAMPGLGAEPLGEQHRVLDVGEQHRHLLALALERGAAGQDALDQMARRIGARIRRRAAHPRRVSGRPH